APAARAEVGWALARLTRGVAVAQVADAVGFSRRRLSTVIRDETGVSPKQWGRIARFERSKDLIVTARRSGDATLADTAAATGYADHAHLTREWREMAGCSPTAWLAEEFPNLQALEVDLG
ncbi:MAG: helix-turn-helix domain-containing protein, partial [Aquihabitans sp.]